MKHQDFDVIVVGAGHAGCEAALASHRMGARTALVTHRFDRIGEMSCNPAIGGVGKGHIVREIDALDGAMGRAADRAGIQFRLLNRSKGPAVHGPRAQTDRRLYRAAMQAEFRSLPALTVIEAETTDLTVEGAAVRGVVLEDGVRIAARCVVLTTGTFLRGVIHIGNQQTPAGRMGDRAAVALAQTIEKLGLPLGRLKTGTPPRLDGRTIDWSRLELQPPDQLPVFLSFMSGRITARQVSCGLTHTNESTHAIIRDNIEASAVHNGQISGAGPRYCPSIEDKVIRFAGKAAHQVFLEPEGLDDSTIYPNGISTSLPPDVQAAYVRTIEGLKNAVVLRPGYAIEYDYIDPRALDRSLRVKALEGLYLAGQINGTTGYEEAGGQGLLAGLTAASAALDLPAIDLNRANSYIGVMVDDLVTKGVTEPYRMFTSRSEFRLHLRADNGDQRLTPLGIAAGCVGDHRRTAFERKMEDLAGARDRLTSVNLSPQEAAVLGVSVKHDGVRRTLFELIGYPDVDAGLLLQGSGLTGFGPAIIEQLSRESRYLPYITRQEQEVFQLRRDEMVLLPASLDYGSLPGLSNELRGKLGTVRPATLAQAGRVEGMTPAALALILMRVRRDQLLCAGS